MRFLNHTPWWLISAGLHAVFLMGAALVTIERLMAVEDTHIIVTPREASTVPDFPVIDSPRDVSTPKAPPRDETLLRPDETAIFFPDVRPSDVDGLTDNDDDRFLKNDVTDFLSYKSGEPDGSRGRQLGHSPGAYNQIGVGAGGGGGGGPFSHRVSCRGRLSRTPEGYGIETSVLASLKWLARHQSPDGRWSASAFCRTCTGAGDSEFDTGVTALSLLAFLGAGYTPLSRDEFDGGRVADVVRKSLLWLSSRQDPEGCVGERGQKYMYNHAIAALALSEAYGMTSAPILLEPAQKAIDFLVAAQNPGKGWRYSAKCGENDTSVTGWAVMALKSAELSGLRFPASAYDGAIHWLNEATEKDAGYQTGYNAAGTGKVFVPGKNEQFAHHPSMSAVAVMSRIFIQKKRDPSLAAANLLVADLPAWQPGQVDFYYWYYASLALFQYDGPKGSLWKKWNEPMKKAIVPNQKTSRHGCENGSWDPAADRWGFEGGRVYAAAINCLTLEVYYRYEHVFGGSAR